MAATEPHDDEMLTAFLDGELPSAERRALTARLATDSALAARLAQLEAGRAGLDAAFGALTEAAPRVALDAMLQRALAQVPATPPVAAALPRRRSVWWQPRALAAAAVIAVAILAGGLGYGLGSRQGQQETSMQETSTQETWQQAVAEYWRLTTPATLALEFAPDLAVAQLTHAGAALDLPLSPEKVALDGPAFRGAQLYEFWGKPLVQIAYLDPDYGPIAFCVIRNGRQGDGAVTQREIDGFGVVEWQGEGFGHMVIGRAPPERLAAFASRLRAQSGEGA